MNIFIIGGGFVGKNVATYFNSKFTTASGTGKSIKLDIRDSEATNKTISKIKPDIVVNASGITGVDKCESVKEEALEINGTAVKNIVNACRDTGAVLVQISTDYVFDGIKGKYLESDPTNPINYYGYSKLIGEEEALEYEKSIILRISTPYGHNYSKKVTFQDFVINNLKAGKTIDVAADQYTSPTYIPDVPKAIEKLHKNKQTGIFHLGCRERISRYTFAIRLADALGLPKEKINRVNLSDLKFKALRPSDTTFNCDKISKFFKISELGESLSSFQ